MSIRILIGHSRPGQRGDSTVLYCGPSGSELEAVKASTRHVASFSIVNNADAIRKHNPNYDPAAMPSAPVSVAIPVPEEITKLSKKELIESLARMLSRIQSLEKQLADLQLAASAHENAKAFPLEAEAPASAV